MNPWPRMRVGGKAWHHIDPGGQQGLRSWSWGNPRRCPLGLLTFHAWEQAAHCKCWKRTSACGKVFGTFDPHSAGEKVTLMQHLMSAKQGTDSASRRSSMQEWGSHTGGAGVGWEQLLWPICVIAEMEDGRLWACWGKSQSLEGRGLRQNGRLCITTKFSATQAKISLGSIHVGDLWDS